MGYVVLEDLSGTVVTGDTPVRVHTHGCRFYRFRNRTAVATKWSGPFQTLEEAINYAKLTGKRWSQARCCSEGSRSLFRSYRANKELGS